MMKPNFIQWMSSVNQTVEAKVGLSVSDLPDMSYRDWYDDGVSSASAAKRAIRAAKEDG